MAGTITVTSPAKGTPGDPTLVKGSTTINFTLKSMGQSEAKIQITVRRVSDNKIYLQNMDAARITPSTTNDDGSGNFNLTFTEGTPEVPYKVEVRAVPVQSGATTYNTDQDLYVLPDLTKPKILSFTPGASSFVKGIVPIKVRIEEANLKDWRVQIDNTDIPGNIGTTVDSQGYFTVNWDTTGYKTDGTKNINIRVRDLADNEVTKTIQVTVDRVNPTIVIQAPKNNQVFAPKTDIVITVDFKDMNTNSISVNGVDIVVRTTSGVFILRPARMSWTAKNANTNTWVGRIRWVNGQLPSTFKIEATAVDKAGNSAAKQTITVKIQ